MTPTFYIHRKGYQARSKRVDSFIKATQLKAICQELTGQTTYTVNWIDARNVGKQFTLETDEQIFVIAYTPPGHVEGRNSFFQSIPTAFRIFTQKRKESHKECSFCLYFTPSSGNNQTNYHLFFYRILLTIGVRFVERKRALEGQQLLPFRSVRELLTERNTNSAVNQANKPTFITDEGTHYNLYGKTFGANQKETSLICLAMSRISNKPIHLYQIPENGSKTLSSEDMKALEDFCNALHYQPISVMDEYGLGWNERQTTKVNTTENLRSQQFVYNLLEKTHGHKQCFLCPCAIEQIVQAAHIYPIAAIKRATALTTKQRKALAVDKDNGMWLCENHHKLFDTGFIDFVNGSVVYTANAQDAADRLYLNSITKTKTIEPEYYNEQMEHYFQLRRSLDSPQSLSDQ